MPNDFLSNLSSRAVQNPEDGAPGNGLQPRLTSRFESRNALAGLAVEQAPDQASQMEDNADTAFRSSATAADQPPVGRTYPAPHEGLVSEILATQVDKREEPKYFLENQGNRIVHTPLKQMSATERLDSSPQPVALAPSQHTELPSLARKDINTVQPDIFPSSLGDSPRAESQQISESHTTVIEMQSPSIDPKKGIPASVPPLLSSQMKVVPERIEVTRIERQPPAPPKASQIMPFVELPASRSQGRAPETQELPPTIHVTIGRIEVKAAPPAAAPKRRTPESATRSLEEYLRRRPGGGQ